MLHWDTCRRFRKMQEHYLTFNIPSNIEQSEKLARK